MNSSKDPIKIKVIRGKPVSRCRYREGQVLALVKAGFYPLSMTKEREVRM